MISSHNIAQFLGNLTFSSLAPNFLYLIFSDEDSNEASESILFHSWVVSKITEFLEVLEFDLNRGCVSHLEAILGQSMYFGLSFSRVGADFRPQLIPIFLKAAERHFNEQIDKGKLSKKNILSTIDYNKLLGFTMCSILDI